MLSPAIRRLLTLFAFARLFIIWQSVWINAKEIGLGITEKTHGTDVALALRQRFQDSVHSIHDTAIA